MSSEEVLLKIDPEDIADVSLVRIMAAVNDLTRVQRLFVADLKASEGFPPEGFDKDTRGFYSYFFRLICGHLREGLVAFRSFIQYKKVLDVVAKWSGENKQRFERLVAACNVRDNQDCIFKKELTNIRASSSFHYQQADFQAQMRLAVSDDPTHACQPKMWIGEKRGHVHYTFADDVLSKLILKEGNYSDQENARLMETIKELHFDLEIIVDQYLAAVDMIAPLGDK